MARRRRSRSNRRTSRGRVHHRKPLRTRVKRSDQSDLVGLASASQAETKRKRSRKKKDRSEPEKLTRSKSILENLPVKVILPSCKLEKKRVRRKYFGFLSTGKVKSNKPHTNQLTKRTCK